jgi:hypothetical protein
MYSEMAASPPEEAPLYLLLRLLCRSDSSNVLAMPHLLSDGDDVAGILF